MDDGLLFFVAGWGAPFTLYVALSALAALRLRGTWRLAALAPAPVMAVVLAATVVGFVQGSNLWPIWLIFASPVALLWVVVALVVHWVAKRRDRAGGTSR